MKALLRIYLRTAGVNTFELLKNDIWISCIHFKPAITAASHHLDLDSWSTPHVVKPVIKTSRFFLFCHISSTRGIEEESIFSNRAKTLLYLNYRKAQISILSVSQTKELITDTGNHVQVFLATPLGLFSNFPGPLPITSCVKTYETCEVELWWLLLLADIFRRQNVEFWPIPPGKFYCLEVEHVRRVSWTAGLHPMFVKTSRFLFAFFVTFLRFVMLQ